MAESRKPLALRHLQSRWPTCQHRSVNTSRCSAWAQPPGPHQAGPWLAGVASWCGGSSVPQLKGGPSHTHTHNPAEAQWVGVSCVCMHATSPTTKIHAPPHMLSFSLQPKLKLTHHPRSVTPAPEFNQPSPLF